MIEQQSAQWGSAKAMDQSGAARVSLLAFVNFAILLPTGVFQYGFGRLVMLAVFLLFLLAWLGWRYRLAAVEAWLFAQNRALRVVLAGAIPLAVLAQSIPSPHKVRVVEAAVMLVLTTWLTADAGAMERRFGRMARLIPLLLVMLACAVPLLNLVSGLSVYKLSDVATTTVDAARLVWAGQNPYTAQIDAYGAINAHGPGYGGYKYLPLMIAVYLPFILPFGPNAVLWVDAATLAVLAALVWGLARTDGSDGNRAAAQRARAGLAALVVIIATPELAETSLAMGYNDVLGVVFVMAAFALWSRSAALAGLMVGCSLSCKLMPGLVALTLLFPANRWKPYILGLAAGLVPDGLALLWDPAPFVRNVLLFNFVRVPDSTSWRMLAPLWVGRLAGLAGMGLWLSVSAGTLLAQVTRFGGARDGVTLDGRMILFSVIVLVLIMTGSTAHDDYMIWWMPAVVALFARDPVGFTFARKLRPA